MIRQAVITLEFEVEDCFEERVREHEIKALVDSVRDNFNAVQLKIIERRPRRGKRAAAPIRVFVPRPVSTVEFGERHASGD